MQYILDGVQFDKKPDYAICYIEQFSQPLKAVIRQQLSDICHGAAAVESGSIIYSYKATLREFLRRYNDQPENKQKGLMGELLTHIIIRIGFGEYYTISPFFNPVERSVKKGFDLVLSSTLAKDLVFTEVKSGELHCESDQDETFIDLINTAKNDLATRISSDDNLSLWLNAINDAKLLLENNNDLKQSVIAVLTKFGESSSSKTLTASECSVFLTGVVFCPNEPKISISSVEKKQAHINKSKTFKSVFVLAIQKSAFDEIALFLMQEANCND